MERADPTNRESTELPSWKTAIAAYRRPVLRRSVFQILTTLIPYLGLWGVMIWTLQISYWMTLAVAVIAAGFLIRGFMIFHDCGHGSFFRSRRANDVWGWITGVLTFTPYLQWRRQHAMHHAAASDLDRRGTGDIWTLTVDEYLEASRAKRVAYRFARNPVVLFALAPLYVFLIEQRFPARVADRAGRRSVYWTNGAIAALAALASVTIGIEAYLLIQLPVLMFAGAAGVWLFYVQHQFEGVYWERAEHWTFFEAAVKGSSFYKLPRLLQWFTGNIGFHHLHHLGPAIPNYNLEECHNANPMFKAVKPITLWASFKSLSFRLWDERRKRLIGYGDLGAIREEARRRARERQPA
jgi:omega-6 fatty acid desaturase (delta-12 desaturase)